MEMPTNKNTNRRRRMGMNRNLTTKQIGTPTNERTPANARTPLKKNATGNANENTVSHWPHGHQGEHCFSNLDHPPILTQALHSISPSLLCRLPP
ncbi:hypothetical protein GALMADRAFT_671889 [Galerina marginata CBS 339.88]|uniref:Uncharacterized protein n=1 Tax=Galerina marginata (strain CBS 339.88) TaxID=685588 RepID=A0A067TKJ4_GALM3|nr:hypothetical protein GALMADRAFT_671889 [Galerina marginata CBS 339.88]